MLQTLQHGTGSFLLFAQPAVGFGSIKLVLSSRVEALGDGRKSGAHKLQHGAGTTAVFVTGTAGVVLAFPTFPLFPPDDFLLFLLQNWKKTVFRKSNIN